MTLHEIAGWGVGWLAYTLVWALTIGLIVVGVLKDN